METRMMCWAYHTHTINPELSLLRRPACSSRGCRRLYGEGEASFRYCRKAPPSFSSTCPKLCIADLTNWSWSNPDHHRIESGISVISSGFRDTRNLSWCCRIRSERSEHHHLWLSRSRDRSAFHSRYTDKSTSTNLKTHKDCDHSLDNLPSFCLLTIIYFQIKSEIWFCPNQQKYGKVPILLALKAFISDQLSFSYLPLNPSHNQRHNKINLSSHPAPCPSRYHAIFEYISDNRWRFHAEQWTLDVLSSVFVCHHFSEKRAQPWNL